MADQAEASDDESEDVAFEALEMHYYGDTGRATPFASEFVQEYINRARPKGCTSQGVPCGILVTISGEPLHYVIPDGPFVEALWGDLSECLLWLAQNAHNPEFLMLDGRETQIREWGDRGVISGFTPEYFIRHAYYRTNHKVAHRYSQPPWDTSKPHREWGHYLITIREAAVLGQLTQHANPTDPDVKLDKWLCELGEWVEAPMSACRDDLLQHQWPPGGNALKYPDWPYSYGAGPHFLRTRPSPLDALLVAHRMAERYGGEQGFSRIYDPLREWLQAQVIQGPPAVDLRRRLPELDRHGKHVPMEDWDMDAVIDKLFTFDTLCTANLSRPEPPAPENVPLVVLQIELCDAVFRESVAEELLDLYAPKALLKRALARIVDRQFRQPWRAPA